MKGSYKINSVKFDFNMDSEDFALNLNSRWNSFFKSAFEKNVAKILDEFDNKKEYTQIESIELDLGEINQENFDRSFPDLLAEKLREKLTELKILSNSNTHIKQLNKTDHNYNSLTYFLLHGYYPWYLQNNKVDFLTLFQNEIKNNAAQLKHFLFSHGQNSSLKKRLIYQLNNENLFEIIKLSNKAESSFIIAYTKSLLDESSYVESNFNQHEDHRKAVWLIIFSYLFSNSESQFNRKEFVRQTIDELAAHYNISYRQLVEYLAKALPTIKSGIFKSDLNIILNQLLSESGKGNGSDYTDNIDFEKIKQLITGHTSIDSFTQAEFLSYLNNPIFKTILISSLNHSQIFKLIDKINNSLHSASFKQYFEAEITAAIHLNIDTFIKEQAQYLKGKNENEAVPDYLKSEYLKILKQAQYRRKLIISLNEVQTIKLLRIINPAESEFIVTYAQSLDFQKENNHFEGKAGGEFKQLKWEFLFTVLVDDHLTSFNRKKYILSVITMLAAHYNLKTSNLLSYFYQSIENQIFAVPVYLKTILSELYFETKEKKKFIQEINIVDKETQENYYAQILGEYIQTGFVSNSNFADKIYASFKYLSSYRNDLLNNLLEELKHGFVLSDQTSIQHHKDLYREIIAYTIKTYQINIPGGRNIKLFIDNLADDRYKGINISALKTMLMALLKNDVSLFNSAWDLLTEKEKDAGVLAKTEFKFITNQQLIHILCQYDNTDFDLFVLKNEQFIFERILGSRALLNQFIELCIYNTNISKKLAQVLHEKYIEFLQSSLKQFYQNEKDKVDFLINLLPNYVKAGRQSDISLFLLKYFYNININQNALENAFDSIIELSRPVNFDSIITAIHEFEKGTSVPVLKQLKKIEKKLLLQQAKIKAISSKRKLQFFQKIFSDDQSAKAYIKLNDFYSPSVKNELEIIINKKPELLLSAIGEFFPDELKTTTLLFQLINKYVSSEKRVPANQIVLQFIFNLISGRVNYFENALTEIYSLCGIKKGEKISNELNNFVKNQYLKKSTKAQICNVQNRIEKHDFSSNIYGNSKSKDEYFFHWLNKNFGGESKAMALTYEVGNTLATQQFELLLIEQSQLITTLLNSGKISELKLAQWVKKAPVSVQYRWLQVIPKSFYKVQIHDAFILIGWIKMYFNEHNLTFSAAQINELLIDFCSGKLQNLSWQKLAGMIIELSLKSINTEKHNEFKLFVAQKAINKGFDWESKIKNLYSEIENMANESKSETNNILQTKTTVMEENENIDSVETIYINNAGLVLCSPYLPRLFEMLDLMDKGQFSNNQAKERAVLILQYLVFENTNFSESEMVLNKVLCGFQTGVPIDTKIELTEKEKDTCLQLLNGIIQNWKALGHVSPEGFRGSFLIREAKLEQKDDSWQLVVESKAYDMLLDRLPWSFTPIKHPWMKKPIHVKWR